MGLEFINNEITKEQVLNSNVMLLSINKSEVSKKNYRRIDELFSIFKQVKTQARGKLIMTFSGYEDDPREICEIPEIRKYVSDMFAKYPYMYYFISSIDLNNRVILSCMVNIQTFVMGQKKDINDVLFSNEDITPINVHIHISKETFQKIMFETINYGESIGEKKEIIMDILDDVLIREKKDRTNIPSLNELKGKGMEIKPEIYNKASKSRWKDFLSESTAKWLVDEDNFGQVMLIHEKKIEELMNSQSIVTPFIINNSYTNIFYINNGNGNENHLCKKCGNNKILVLKPNMGREHLKDCCLLPDYSTYLNVKITPLSDKFLAETQIPISPNVDLWYCPKCKEIHKFQNSKNGELIF